MAAVQQTVDTVKTLDVDAYKYGFSTDIESDKATFQPVISQSAASTRLRPLRLAR